MAMAAIFNKTSMLLLPLDELQLVTVCVYWKLKITLHVISALADFIESSASSRESGSKILKTVRPAERSLQNFYKGGLKLKRRTTKILLCYALGVAVFLLGLYTIEQIAGEGVAVLSGLAISIISMPVCFGIQSRLDRKEADRRFKLAMRRRPSR